MTPVDIDKLKELVAKATPTPWEESDGERGPNFYLEIRGPYDGDVDGDTGQHIVVGGEPICSFLDNERDYQDCALVIAAVNSLPALIAKAERVEAMEAALTEVAAMFDQFAAALREHDPAAMAQEIAVAELAASEARNALSPKESE